MRKTVKLKVVHLRKNSRCEVCGKQLCRNRLAWYEFYVQNGKPNSVHRCFSHPYAKEFYDTYNDTDTYTAYAHAIDFYNVPDYKKLYEERMKEKKERLQK